MAYSCWASEPGGKETAVGAAAKKGDGGSSQVPTPAPQVAVVQQVAAVQHAFRSKIAVHFLENLQGRPWLPSLFTTTDQSTEGDYIGH